VLPVCRASAIAIRDRAHHVPSRADPIEDRPDDGIGASTAMMIGIKDQHFTDIRSRG
jgi:hypothetical protein